MEDKDEQIFGETGDIHFILTDKRIPVEMAYNNLRSFDEISYVTDIAEFISRCSDPKEEISLDDMIQLFGNQGLTSLDQYLLKIIKYKLGFGEAQINKLHRSETLRKLYDLGCPELYYFHKTATETTTFGIEGKTIVPNPLNARRVWLARDHRTIYDYLRPQDKKPFVLAFPMYEVLQAEEETQQGSNHDEPSTPPYASFITNTINFAELPANTLSGITAKTKVFSIDYGGRKKLETFIDAHIG